MVVKYMQHMINTCLSVSLAISPFVVIFHDLRTAEGYLCAKGTVRFFAVIEFGRFISVG